MAVTAFSVPTWNRMRSVGGICRLHGCYVYAADPFTVTIGASNGSLAGMPLMRWWIVLTWEAVEAEVENGFDLVGYACSEIRKAVCEGYKMYDPSENEVQRARRLGFISC